MKIDCLCIREDCFLEKQEFVNLSPEWIANDTCRWLDIEGADSIELLEMFGALYLPPRIMSRLQDEAVIPGYEVFDRALFVSLPLLSIVEGGPRPTLQVLIVSTTLITMHAKPLPLFEELKEEVSGYVRLSAPTIQALVYQIMLRVSDHVAQSMMQTCREIDHLSSFIDEAPTKVEMNAIVALKKRVSRLARTSEDVMTILQVFRTSSCSAFEIKEQVLNFSLLLERYQQFHRAVVRFETRLEDLRNNYRIGLQEIANLRLRVLTLLSALFLPLTLIAGIYGMNFEHMPELDEPLAYFVVLGIMVCVAGGMTAFFYWRGWFKS